MRAVVLEPDGQHWVVERPDKDMDKPLSVPVTNGVLSPTQPRGVQVRMPVMTLKNYTGHQFLDGIGNCYWIYVRVK